MTNTHDSAESTAHKMRLGRFLFLVGLQFAIAIGLFRLIGPHEFEREVHMPGASLLWAILFGVPLSLFEYLYHRYLLHSAVLPFLQSMHKAHTLHHSLTSVKAPVRGDEPSHYAEVKSDYPVEHEHQAEAMEFPFYSVSIFMAIFTILIALPAKALFPGCPAFMGTLLGVTLYYSSYELWHAVLHLPYEKFWQPALEARFTRKTVRRVYSFHLMHHWRPSSNLAIVGLWGFAVWDHIFRTHRRPERLPLDGAQVTFNDAVLGKPLWPISALDQFKGKSFKWSRNIENWAARVFLRRSTNR